MDEQLLKDYVATYLNPQYNGDWDLVNSKFPELSGVDKQLLKDYVATYLNPQYNGDWATVNSKFPELFPVKKKEDMASSLEATSLESPSKTEPTESVAYSPFGFAAGLQRTPEYKTPDEFEGKGIGEITGELLKIAGKGVAKFVPDVLETAAIVTAGTNNLIAKTGLTDTMKATDVTIPIGLANVNLYGAAKAYKDLLNEYVPTDKEIESGFWGQTATAVGQMVPIILSGFVSGGAKAVATEAARRSTSKLAPVVNALDDMATRIKAPEGILTFSQVTAPSYEQAIQEGATEDEALTYAVQNAVVSFPLEMLPVDRLFKRLDKAFTGNQFVNVVKKGFIGGSEEFMTEGFQNMYENLSANMIYDANKDIFEGIGDAASVGGAVGFLMNASLTALLGKRATLTDPQEIETIDIAIEELESKINSVNDNNDRIIETVAELKANEPISLRNGDSQIGFIKKPDGTIEMAENAVNAEQAESTVNYLSKTYSKIQFTSEPIESDDPYSPTQYRIVGRPIAQPAKYSVDGKEVSAQEIDKLLQEKTADELLAMNIQIENDTEGRVEKFQQKIGKQDAVQEQATSQVPLQPEARVGQEMAQGEPKAEPQVVTQEGGQEEVVSLKTPTQEEIDLESAFADDLDLIKSETAPRLRVGDINIPAEEDINIETIEENLDKLPAYEVNFTTPDMSQDIQVNPIEESKSSVKDGTAESRTIESYQGIPMIVGMSDILSAGTVTDAAGNPMKTEGGLLYNVLGKNKNAAWAGVTQAGAETHYNEALELYNNNKELFETLWAEGKLPNGHVPMAIMRMADTAINSNEAVFRYLLPLIKSQPETRQADSLEALKKDIESRKSLKGIDKISEFISKNNIKTLGGLFEAIISDAKLRAEGDTKNTLSLTDRSNIFDLIISPQGTSSASKNAVTALFGSKKSPESKAFLADTIYNAIGEPSMLRTPKGNIVAVVGVDVLNGGVVKVDHGNYGFGTKGKMISLISNPKHGLDIFPEWKAKAVRVFKKTEPKSKDGDTSKEGKLPSDQKIADEVGGAFFADKAFRGARVSQKPSDVELLAAKLRFAFPDVTVSNTKEDFERILQQEGVRTKESEGKIILGLTKDGKIYLNPDSDSLATPIHEFGHIWIDFLRSKASGKKGDALLAKGLSLVEGTKALQKAIEKYGDNPLAREEALVELMATKGESIINSAKKKDFKNWLNALFKYVKEYFTTSESFFRDKAFKDKLEKMSLDDFVNIGLADLLKGESVSSEFKARESDSGAMARFELGDNVRSFIKKARAQGFSEEAIRNTLIRKGVDTETINNAFAKETGAAARVEITEEFAKGYDRVKREIEGIIERSRKRGRPESEIMQNVINYLQGSRMYIDATDVQREKMVRDVRKLFGKREKSAPSPKKLFGEAKNVKEITMSEYDLLKKQIRDTAAGARNAMSAWKKASADLVKYLKDMVKGGHVSTKQSVIILKKFSGVNLLSDESVSNFVDYMAKVFNNADYAEQISTVRSLLKNARRNTKDKIGIAKNLTPLLNRVLAINPTMIPDSVFKKYYDLVNMMGQRKTVLELDEIGQVTQVAQEIIDGIDTELNQVDELALRFDAYDDKVIKDGKVDFAATVNQMKDDKLITEEEANLLKKYKSLIVESESRKKTDEEIAKEKKALVESVNKAALNPNTLPTTDEKNLARTLADLIRTNAVEGLDNTQLKNLLKLIDNINNGYLPHYAELMVEKLNGIKDAKILDGSLSKAKPLPVSKFYSRLKSLLTKKDGLYEMVRRQPLFYIDQLFGDFNTKNIFNTVFKSAAEGESKFVKEYGDIRSMLDNALNEVSSSFKFNHNKTVKSSYKMMTYLLQLEYISNPDSKKVHSAKDYLEKTIKTINKGNTKFGEADAKILQEILDEYVVDGNLDIDKLYDSFNDAELSAIETIQDINKSLESKAEYTAAVIRGNKITPINNYVHHNVLFETISDENIDSASSISNYNNSMSPSTKAKSLIERTDRVTPLNFDVFASANRGSRFVLMDYHLTAPIRTTRKTINEARKLASGDKKKTEILNAIDKAFNESVNNLLMNNMMSTSFIEDAADYISRQGYRAVLASIPRFVGELSSNLAFVAIASPKDFAAGVGLRGVAMSSDASDILNNLGSTNTNRLYPHDTLVGRTVDSNILNQAHGISGGKSKNSVVNKMQQIYNLTLKKPKNIAEATADVLISTPDKLVMQPLWFGAFSNAFQSITGSKPDFDKIAQNDEAYMAKFKDALAKSRETADKKSVLTGASDNAFMGILKGTSKPNQSALIRAFNNFNSFMTRFLIYEYITARTGIYALVNGGTISRKDGAALLGAVTTRMVMYTLVTSLLSEAMVGMFVDRSEEEDEKSLIQKFGQALMSSMTSLILGRDFGNATKSMISYGVEWINKEHLDFLREGEYDPYKDAIQYQIIPPTKQGREFETLDLILNLSGSYSPALKSLAFAIQKFTEDPKKKADAIERSENEMQVRLPLEILGNLGYVPFYKDVRKIVNAEIYKSLSKSQNKLPEDKKFKMSKEDMKTYYPELYQDMYGVGGYMYEKEMIEKEVEAEKKRMKKEMEMFK